MEIDSNIKMLERFKLRTVETLCMMYHESTILGANSLKDQQRFESDLERQEAILCKIIEEIKFLKNKKAILCNCKNASETPVEGSNEGGATNQPQNAQEGR